MKKKIKEMEKVSRFALCNTDAVKWTTDLIVLRKRPKNKKYEM